MICFWNRSRTLIQPLTVSISSPTPNLAIEDASLAIECRRIAQLVCDCYKALCNYTDANALNESIKAKIQEGKKAVCAIEEEQKKPDADLGKIAKIQLEITEKCLLPYGAATYSFLNFYVTQLRFQAKTITDAIEGQIKKLDLSNLSTIQKEFESLLSAAKNLTFKLNWLNDNFVSSNQVVTEMSVKMKTLELFIPQLMPAQEAALKLKDDFVAFNNKYISSTKQAVNTESKEQSPNGVSKNSIAITSNPSPRPISRRRSLK